MTERVRITLEIDRDLEPPRGTLVDPAGGAVPFSGWMQLASALAAVCAAAPEQRTETSG